jgi:hypothetical protein
VSRGERTDEQLAAWAREHLSYEVDTLIFALEQLDGKAPGMHANLALESFAVHARCLFDFLWGKPNPRFDNDAFASDFTDDWKGRRGAVPEHLAMVQDRGRFGREVFHLTYERIDGADDRKSWPCGLIALELAQALRLFADLARPAALDAETRSRLRSLLFEEEEEGKPAERIATLDGLRVSAIGGATSMDPSQYRGGTINVRNIEAGGK